MRAFEGMSGSMWPLPFEDELVEGRELVELASGVRELGGSAVPHSIDHGTAPTGPILAPASAGALSDAMIECIHLLPTSQCTLCKGVKDGFIEESWEKRDYAQVELTDGGVVRQGHDTEYEVSVDALHPRDVYGTQVAARINRSTLGGA